MTNLPAQPDQPQPEPSVERLVEKVRPYLRHDKVPEATAAIVTYTRNHSGPLPTPETFHGYEQVLPGAAERIMAMAEREQGHRHGAESSIIRHEIAGRYVGQLGALIALLSLLSCVAFCAYIGQPIAAGVIGAIGAIVIGFLKFANGGKVPNDEPEPRKQPAGKKRKR